MKHIPNSGSKSNSKANSKSGTNLSDSAPQQITLLELWREFLPLSLSDVTMACGDPAVTVTLAYLPEAQVNLASVGVAKSLAILFESPIIMILHASNALASNANSRLALWRFTLLSGGILSGLLYLLALPPVFNLVGLQWLAIPGNIAASVQSIILIMGGWAFVIAWRRYFQGLLIYHGHAAALAKASLVRLGVLGITLAIGFSLKSSGGLLAGSAMMIGVISEGILITVFAYRLGAVIKFPNQATNPNYRELTEASDVDVPSDQNHQSPNHKSQNIKPQNIKQVWRFYYPLANSMLVVWGGRALLLSILGRGNDATMAIASWSAAWGLVLVIANSTRMVQQIIIKYQTRLAFSRLFLFALSIGLTCSLILLLMVVTPISDQVIGSFIGNDLALVAQIKPVILICAIIPMLTALQNAGQGFLVGQGKTNRVNLATWLGTFVLLAVTFLSIQNHLPGATAAAVAMVAAMVTELVCLWGQLYWQHSNPSPTGHS
jgi:progressive ankylosis protein